MPGTARPVRSACRHPGQSTTPPARRASPPAKRASLLRSSNVIHMMDEREITTSITQIPAVQPPVTNVEDRARRASDNDRVVQLPAAEDHQESGAFPHRRG